MRYTFADLIAAAQAIDAVERMKADLAEFAAENLHALDDDGIIEFLDIATGDAFNVQPSEAMGYFKSKGLRATFSYADMIGRAHDQAFTVAKMMDVDLLKQVRDSLDSALANGTAFSEWKATIGPILKAAGWWGESPLPDPLTGQMVNAQLGSAWRLETIFRTNLQTAYAAGQWRQIQDQAEVAPFLMYDAVDDFRTRPAHRAWDGTVLPASSTWWKTHYPPNGWNCRCSVIQLDGEQLRQMGITPRGEAPDDGDYTWTNPRTGEKIRVPNGVDPGFDRNAGDAMQDDLRSLLTEKVDALPKDMQVAIAPVLRREFDTSTAAGKWHATSFDNAPDWMRDKLIDHQRVEVQTLAKSGAWARGGFLVEMDGYTVAEAKAQSVWRHEFGHIVDSRLGRTALFRSAQDDFVAAQKADADELAAAAGNGRKSKANDVKRKAVLDAYENARNAIIDAPRETRTDILRKLAEAADLDFGKFLEVVRQSTLILEGMDDLQDVGKAVRIARMIEAVRLGDGEGFVRWSTFKEAVEEIQRAGKWDKDLHATVSSSWRKDGSLASLSDLIGSATRNRAANYHDGFSGHSNSYYRKGREFPTTESFANLMSLAAHPNAYWWTLTERFAPEMAKLFRQIMEGKV
jgi:SPP1 gp7 family putative phage head morphogenesis protein